MCQVYLSHDPAHKYQSLISVSFPGILKYSYENNLKEKDIFASQYQVALHYHREQEAEP